MSEQGKMGSVRKDKIYHINWTKNIILLFIVHLFHISNFKPLVHMMIILGSIENPEPTKKLLCSEQHLQWLWLHYGEFGSTGSIRSPWLDPFWYHFNLAGLIILVRTIVGILCKFEPSYDIIFTQCLPVHDEMMRQQGWENTITHLPEGLSGAKGLGRHKLIIEEKCGWFAWSCWAKGTQHDESTNLFAT